MDKCPCGFDMPYENCCKPIIIGDSMAETAEQLMRSRYSAYVMSEIDYIIDSTISDKRKDLERKKTKQWSEKSEWHKLEIINTSQGGKDDNSGTVEFIAHFTYKGNKTKQHEISSFKRVDKKWFFVDSESVPIKQFKRDSPRIGRNDPCTCGSGKKYKKCCGK